MPILPQIADLAAEMTGWRRHLHAHPELGYKEFETARFVADKLTEWGIPFVRLTETGIVATLKKGTGAGAIGLRADMDALPIRETTGVPHASTVEGVMHACGHDGHTATLLGAMKYLAEFGDFDGTVHAIFQPAEEGLAGARSLIDAGLFEQFPCDMVFGQHNDPLLEEGWMAVSAGPMMAASDRFAITVKGKGGHAARPHHSIDPLTAAAQVVVSLQTLVSRRLDPLESGVVSVTRFQSGSNGNVIPEEAELFGTARSLRPEVQDEIERLIAEVATNAAATLGAEADVRYLRGYPPVVNAPEPAAVGAAAARAVVGDESFMANRPPAMGGEDFAFMAEAVPGCFARIGTAPKGTRVPGLHNSAYDFNDAMLPVGASWFAQVAMRVLAPASAEAPQGETA